MGWMYVHKPKEITVENYFANEWNVVANNDNQTSQRLLNCAVVQLRTAYIAMEKIRLATGDREVFAVICLLAYNRHDYHNFGYKDMDETMGPYACEAPQRILDLLTPTSHDNALAWRAACNDNLALKKRIVKGAILSHPSGARFQVIERGRYKSLADGGLYKMSKKTLLEMTVASDE